MDTTENLERPLPPPVVRMSEGEFANLCTRMAALDLAKRITAEYDLGIADVWAALHALPNSAMPLFLTPEGWRSIAAHAVTVITGEPCETALPVLIH